MPTIRFVQLLGTPRSACEGAQGAMAARILIADDSPLVQTSLTQLLESYCENWKVCGLAATGHQAVEKAVESQPDLIILNLKMPLMDGLTASVVIGHYLPKVPILMYTVHKSLDLDATARKAGVARVISKAEPEELLKAAEELLGGRRMTVSGASI